MDQAKQARLTAKGWRCGSVAEFLGLTPEEAATIEQRLTQPAPPPKPAPAPPSDE